MIIDRGALIHLIKYKTASVAAAERRNSPSSEIRLCALAPTQCCIYIEKIEYISISGATRAALCVIINVDQQIYSNSRDEY